MDGIKSRHPEISLRVSESIKSRSMEAEENIESYLDLLETSIRPLMNHPERIFNADESAIILAKLTSKILISYETRAFNCVWNQ